MKKSETNARLLNKLMVAGDWWATYGEGAQVSGYGKGGRAFARLCARIWHEGGKTTFAKAQGHKWHEDATDAEKERQRVADLIFGRTPGQDHREDNKLSCEQMEILLSGTGSQSLALHMRVHLLYVLETLTRSGERYPQYAAEVFTAKAEVKELSQRLTF